MKKLILILVAVLCLGFSVSAKERYKVTVYTKITYTYYDDKGNVVGTTTSTPPPIVNYSCADTKEKARQEVVDECSSQCSRSYNKDEGMKSYNGKMYQCYSTKEVTNSVADAIGQSC
ncbi:MAG: hypothetical protein LBU83_11055 [Bacteroidales bacterium]|jgi:hypothetical protein|nr:hypothetical protein [Bacteroidales bacterium]